MTQSEKTLLVETGNLDLIPHEVPKCMYGVITEEHTDVPPNLNNTGKFMVDWLGEYHLKLFDDTKNTDEVFWKEDLYGVKWPDDREFS